MKPPIFVVGCPRTGTTWVWGMLDAHPGTVSLLPEDAIGGPGIETAIFTHEAELSDDAIREIVDRKMVGEERVMLEKTPIHLWHLDRIWRLYPEARIVVLTRSPYGAVNAMIRARDIPGMDGWNPRGAWYRWAAAATITHEVQDDSRVKLVNYEQLTEGTEEVLAELLEWLGLAPTPEIAGMFDGVPAHTNPSGLIRKGTADSWETELKPEMISFITRMLTESIDREEAA